MNFRNLTLTACFFAAFLKPSMAQDIHFTQFYMMPQTLNPALAGKFQGSVRVGGIYRDQFRSVIGADRFSTPGAFVDIPIRGLRKRDWIGIGLSAFQDEVGSLALKHSGLKLGGAYHIGLDKKGQNVLSIGVSASGENRSVNGKDALFTDGFEQNDQLKSLDYGRYFDPQNPSKYTTYSAGAVFSSKVNKQSDVQIGFSLNNLNKPDLQIAAPVPDPTPPPIPLPTPQAFQLPRRFVLHGKFNTQINKKTTLTPAFLFQNMAGQREIMLQGIVGYLFDKEKDITLRAGLGYRMRDAAAILLGARIKDIEVGLAYDVNVSKLVSETRYRGGFELAVNKVFRVYKPPVSKPKILCPRF